MPPPIASDPAASEAGRRVSRAARRSATIDTTTAAIHDSKVVSGS
jgi:hypothetical protein